MPNPVRHTPTVILGGIAAAAVFALNEVPGWQQMWAIALSLLALFKWITFAYHPALKSPLQRPWLYLLGWVGMDPLPFAAATAKMRRNNLPLLLGGILNIFVGLLCLLMAEQVPARLWLLQGWLICAAIVFFAHFGVFRAMAWWVQLAGVSVEPIMRLPLATKTVAEFWGGRWNMAFKQLVYPFVFNPCKRLFGPNVGVLVTFLISGILHELVISLPAKAGWGLPTLYFLLQALAMLLERAETFKSLPTLCQRLFTYTVVAAPAFFLFHPPFIHNVIIPFGRAVGLEL